MIVETPNEPGAPSRLSFENVTDRPPDVPRKIIVGRVLNYENPSRGSSNSNNLDLKGESNSSLSTPLDKKILEDLVPLLKYPQNIERNPHLFVGQCSILTIA